MLKTQELVLYNPESSNASIEELVTSGPVVVILGQKLLSEGITGEGFKSNIDFLKSHVMPQLHSFVAGEHGAHADVPFAKVPTGQVDAEKTQELAPWGL